MLLVMVSVMLCHSPTPQEPITRGGDYSTLKGDLAESCLQWYYVTLSTKTAMWPQSSPVFRLTICPYPSKAHRHSLQHSLSADILVLKRPCFGDERWIDISHSSGCEDELYKQYEEDVGAWRQEITSRCANEWLILDWLQITMLIYCTDFLFSSRLDRYISKSYSLCVGEEK